MEIKTFIENLESLNVGFYTGVPDSQLKSLCDYLITSYGINNTHMIAVNEGNALALATGYHLATGKVPCVYLQNSGLGNIVNPLTSLTHPKVYGIPTVFVVGWRGQPQVHDEPQHIYMGEITEKLLVDLDLKVIHLTKTTTEDELKEALIGVKDSLESGKSLAFLVSKDALSSSIKQSYKNDCPILREHLIQEILSVSQDGLIVSTTGKTSREVFEVREQRKESHEKDFLTVGSMGHSSTIALGLALHQPTQKVWCIDGDGAVMMHMGAMALIGDRQPKNLIHIVINNGAHESVGGQPTSNTNLELSKITKACGYSVVVSAHNLEEFKRALSASTHLEGPIFIEMRSAIGSRDDLGRPASTPTENKKALMSFIKEHQ
jgi:phosphonopyruvate decarboxylase